MTHRREFLIGWSAVFSGLSLAGCLGDNCDRSHINDRDRDTVRVEATALGVDEIKTVIIDIRSVVDFPVFVEVSAYFDYERGPNVIAVDAPEPQETSRSFVLEALESRTIQIESRATAAGHNRWDAAVTELRCP